MRLRFRKSPEPKKAYAFGSTVKERTISYTQKYRFGFNNQEQETELGDYYSFEYRVHDARLGRFLSVDPWEKKYAFQSVYIFAFNCPISKIDFLGLGDPYRPAKTPQGRLAPGELLGDFCRRYNVQGYTLADQLHNLALANPQSFKYYPETGTQAQKLEYWNDWGRSFRTESGQYFNLPSGYMVQTFYSGSGIAKDFSASNTNAEIYYDQKLTSDLSDYATVTGWVNSAATATSPTKSSYEMPFYDKLYQSIGRSPGDEGEPPAMLKFSAAGLGVDYSYQGEVKYNGQVARSNVTISNELYGNTENSATHKVSLSANLDLGTSINMSKTKSNFIGGQEIFGYFMLDYGNSNQVSSNSITENRIVIETETSIQISRLKLEYNSTNSIFKIGISSTSGFALSSAGKLIYTGRDSRRGILKN
ncbi:MAG: hypothetical protein JNL57_02730 [Bacteroidetes bacterium]|nr:hypothetical protein [Bacteroidota bacterium]